MEELILILTNQYQTPITKELVDSLPLEVLELFLDFINNVPYIRNLISPKRLRARDCPRDKNGKIIIDLTNPPILEDMDYFRPTALHYQKTGRVSDLRPNPNPNSEYGKWVREEVRRCYEGYVRPSDGLWITGDMYFFLNYCPILLSKITEGKKALRVWDFPEVWEGHFLKFHYANMARNNGHHGSELSRRGSGKSYSLAAMIAKRFLLGEYKEANREIKCLVTAYQKEYLVKDGILNKFQSYIDFCALNTQFPSRKLRASLQDMNWKAGYIDLDTGSQRGTLNEVIGVSSKDDESKLRGKRGVLIAIEEWGSFPNLLGLYGTLRPSVEEGDVVYGEIFALGTAGDEGSDFAAAQEIMYNPIGYNMQEVLNVYDKEGQGRKYFVYFFPGYMNRKGCYNNDGVSDVVKALVEILMNRYKVKYNSTDINAITKTISEIPITPQEAIIRSNKNIFPITELTARLNEIDNNPNFFNDVLTGTLYLTKDGTIEFKPTTDIPIRDFPTKDNKVTGCLEAYELPLKVLGEVPAERYIIGFDNYENDVSNTMSLGSMFVFDLWTDRIVAEYTGRPMFVDDLNEMCRKLCLFYNARCCYENNKKNTFAYFSKMNSLYLLADTPEYLKQKLLIKTTGYGNAHTYNTKIYTPQGLRKWGDLLIGDYVFSEKGTPIKIIDIPFDDIVDCYKITLKDGRTVECSEGHLFKVVDWNGLEKLLSVKDMLLCYYRNKGKYKEYKYYIPKAEAVEFPYLEVEINPYFLGLMLGDGCFTLSRHNKCNFASSEEDFKCYYEILKYPYRKVDDRHYWIDYPEFGKKIKFYNLNTAKSHTKFIPDAYKFNTKEIRLDIIRGLMDTDGCCLKDGVSTFTTVSKLLAEDVLWVLRSLGINSSLKELNNSYGKVYNITIQTIERIFNLPRKYNKLRLTKTRSFKTAICNIEYIGTKKAKCITVNTKEGLYQVEDFILTHNTAKGIGTTVPIKNYGFTCIRDWLLKPVTTTQKIDGVELEVTVPNLHFIKSRALLKELILFNPDINVDRIMSLVQTMLYRQEKIILYQGEMRRDDEKVRADYAGNDEFFNKNYDLRKFKSLKI